MSDFVPELTFGWLEARGRELAASKRRPLFHTALGSLVDLPFFRHLIKTVTEFQEVSKD